ncbi:MAG: hypothetical protein AMJ69_05555 [Gammaproteobacteria bacterium SG8_47]|nr:MAG: hypothetical protein AMJ69_05555 [Gammaproteobacteria bacterium SG8_47]
MQIRLIDDHMAKSQEFADAVVDFGSTILGRFARHVATIEVNPYSDNVSARSRWRCQLRMRLRSRGELVVNAADRELDGAIVRAFGRARRLIGRVVRVRSIKEWPLTTKKGTRILRLINTSDVAPPAGSIVY